jgi:hypothetical protein
MRVNKIGDVRVLCNNEYAFPLALACCPLADAAPATINLPNVDPLPLQNLKTGKSSRELVGKQC